MQRRLGRGGRGSRAGWVLGPESHGEMCWVCESYEIQLLLGSENDYEITATAAPSRSSMWRHYEPLTDCPDLFLSFARLYERERTVKTASDWVHGYGLLGVGVEDEGAEDTESPEDEEGSEDVEIVTRETTWVFFREVKRAAAILAAYEVHLSGDSLQAERVTREQFRDVTEPWWDYYCEELGGMEKDFGGYPGFAYTFAVLESERMARRLASPCIAMDLNSPPRPSLKSRWILRGPLGAMYLQMYGLIRAGEDIVRCIQCGGPIALSSPVPDHTNAAKRNNRKTRQDKRLCGDACRKARNRQK